MEYKAEFTEEFSVILKLENENLILENRDILDFHFTEDIFAFSMYGRMTFIDKYGVAEYGPLTGNEQIVIKYGRDEDRQLVFDMVRVNKIAQSNVTEPTRENGIVIDFADTSFTNFTSRRFSRSWNNKKISSIVKHILENMIGNPTISLWEDNNKEISVCFPYFTPMEMMKWLSKRGIGLSSGMPGFLYYTNTDEGFSGNWVTMDYLFGTEPYQDPNVYVFESENQYYMNKIMYWSISGIDKILMKHIKGGHRFGYDFQTKSFINQEYGYEKSIKKTMLAGDKSLYPDITDYRSLYKFVGENNSEDVDNIYYSEFIERYNLQQILTIVVRGSEYRHAGMHVDIEWASSDKSQLYNKMWKKKWVVKSITHMFNSKHNIPYRQKMILMKNAYYDIDQTELIKSTRRNK